MCLFSSRGDETDADAVGAEQRAVQIEQLQMQMNCQRYECLPCAREMWILISWRAGSTGPAFLYSVCPTGVTISRRPTTARKATPM
jgi:hypothetical protein